MSGLPTEKTAAPFPIDWSNAATSPSETQTANDGLWKISGKRQAVYAKAQLPLREQLEAARRVAGQSSQ